MKRSLIEILLLEELKRLTGREDLLLSDIKEYGSRRHLLEVSFKEEVEELYFCQDLNLWATVIKE